MPLEDNIELHDKVQRLENGHALLAKGHEGLDRAIGVIRDSQQEITIAVGKIATYLEFAYRSGAKQDSLNAKIFAELDIIKRSVADLPTLREKVGWFVVGCGIILSAVLLAIVNRFIY